MPILGSFSHFSAFQRPVERKVVLRLCATVSHGPQSLFLALHRTKLLPKPFCEILESTDHFLYTVRTPRLYLTLAFVKNPHASVSLPSLLPSDRIAARHTGTFVMGVSAGHSSLFLWTTQLFFWGCSQAPSSDFSSDGSGSRKVKRFRAGCRRKSKTRKMNSRK